jgi:hypothetical protein
MGAGYWDTFGWAQALVSGLLPAFSYRDCLCYAGADCMGQIQRFDSNNFLSCNVHYGVYHFLHHCIFAHNVKRL